MSVKHVLTSIRQGNIKDLPSLKELFVGTIEHVCDKDYTPSQISVWTASVKNEKRWIEMMEQQYVLIAEIQNKIVGFCTLKSSNYLDFFYVHKDYQGRNIAKRLYKRLEEKATEENQNEITSDVSITAKPFFEKVGFRKIQKQQVERDGVELTNYKMVKQL